MTHPLMQMLMRWGVLALGVAIATRVVPGIHCDDMTALVVVVLLLSFFNAILKPILVLFTLPFILVTMGLGVVVINALLFLFVGKLVQGFQVDGFWAALWGALVVSVTTFVVSRLIGSTRRARPGATPPAPRPPGKSDDVIDI